MRPRTFRFIALLVGVTLIASGVGIFYFVCGQPGTQLGAALLSGLLVGWGAGILVFVAAE